MNLTRKTSVAIGLITALAVIVAWAVLRQRELPGEQSLVAVEKGSFEIRVDTVGVLDAGRGFQVASQMRGDRGKIIQLVEDGARVAANDVLLRFEPSPFEADILRLTGELTSRTAVVESMGQSLEVEKSQAEKTVTHAQFELKLKKQDYQRYLAYISDLQGLKKKGHQVESEIIQAQRKAEQMFTELQKLESDLSRQEREVVFKVAHAMADLNKAQSEADTARDTLTQARADMARTEVRAPSAGFVVLNEWYQGNQKRKPRAGDTVFQGQPLLYLPDLSSMQVKSQLREEDLHKIKIGQIASVRVDAYPDASFQGVVDNIGVLAVDATESGNIGKHFQYTVKLKGTDERLRPGMTSRVNIISDRVKDALRIPVAALFQDDKQRYCYVRVAGKLELITVKVGRSNEDWVEILEGLAVGQQVSLLRP
jgi:HlyD family secretion protein